MQRPDRMREQDLEIVRGFCEARAREGVGEMMGCLAEDVVWHYPGRNALSREYRGKEEVAAFFRGLREPTGSSCTSETERIVVDESAAFVAELPRGTRKGKTLKWRTVLMLRLRDGKIW